MIVEICRKKGSEPRNVIKKLKGMIILIAQEISFTPRMEKLEAFLRRVPTSDSKWYEALAELKRRLAGYRGEKSLDFHLSMLPDSEYLIFHGLRLLLGKYYFQIDILILCAKFALAMEVKNMSGELSFEKKLNQVIWKRNGTEERIQSPVQQARLQARKLKIWLLKHNCPDIPIHYMFVNSNEKTIIRIETGNEQILRYICNSENLIDRIEEKANYYQEDKLDSKEIKKIKRLLLANNTPDNPDILKAYNKTSQDIPTGVQCPNCNAIPIVYKNGKWHCQRCKAVSKTAHIPAINDYFLLIKQTITTRELCQFLHIGSINIGYKIMKSLNLSYTGNFRNRVYYQPKKALGPPLQLSWIYHLDIVYTKEKASM
ncbi:nuclease-related domain-containing protein [Neobacillus mesonae]|uniref:nuclease-related domain-containing protein n=1 Tax=Neobacillus mesonae TaxID=1193713 RepID=UPI002E1F1417|nr:nuclease-related domain-containing protein [Neobacillus mesonae]